MDFAHALNQACDEQHFDISWYLKDLSTGYSAHREGEMPVPSGSVRKIGILLALLHSVNEGNLSMDDELTVTEEYQKNRSGCFQHLRPGFTITVRDAIIMMIIVSDNTCTGMLVDMIGNDAINEYLQNLGLTNTVNTGPFPPIGKECREEHLDKTSAKEMGRLLELILLGCDDEAVAQQLGCTTLLCRFALETLKKQKMNGKLPSALPNGASVAHKTGGRAEIGVHCDAGIVFKGDAPLFILTAFTRKKDRDVQAREARRFIGDLCRMCYNHLAS